MSDRAYQYSALLISHDIIAESMAGPGIRYYHLARVLGKHMPTALAVPEDSSDSIPHENFDLLHYTGGQWATLEPHVAKSRTCILPSAIADGYPKLASSGACLVVDGYDPLLAEWLELPPLHHAGRFTSEWQKLMVHLGSQYSLGDFFICASERQRDWWLGLLEANGRINPATHGVDRSLRSLIDVVAYGMPEEPAVHKQPVVKGVWDGIGAQDKLLVWGGGLWPWLDPVTAIEAVGKASEQRDDVRLIFPGTKHPNPILTDMPTRLPDARRVSDELDLTDKHVFFGDWLPYDLWSSLLLESDIALILHLDTLETRLAFRSRVLEYIWCNLPIVSSTGDAMSELVAKHDLGYVVDYEDSDAVADAILSILDEPTELRQKQFAAVRDDLTWEKLAAPLIDYCKNPKRAADKNSTASGENEFANPWVQLQLERRRYQEIIDGYEHGKVLRSMNWVRSQWGYLRKPGSRPTQLTHEHLSGGGQRVSHLQKNGGYFAQLACYRFALDLCQGQRVIDVGSGDGSGAHYLASNGAKQVTGIDYDESVVRNSKRIFKSDYLTFKVHDGQRLGDFPAASADVVIVINTLEQLYQVDEFLDGCMDVLTPDGTLIAAIRTATESSVTEAPYDGADFTTWSAAEWRERLSSHFTQVRVYTETLALPGMGIDDDLATFLKSIPDDGQFDETSFVFRAVDPLEYRGDLLSVIYVCSNSSDEPSQQQHEESGV